MSLQALVNQAVKQVCPIDGVSFGQLANKATWVVHYQDGATAQQRANAQAVIDAFDCATADVDAARLAEIDTALIGDATLASLKAMTASEFDTWWAANVTTLAQANNVLKRLARVVIRRVL